MFSGIFDAIETWLKTLEPILQILFDILPVFNGKLIHFHR